jgi:predicted metal-dependent HD superfamily phosphohydrolase
METYKIVRKYRDSNHPDNNKVIETGLTLEEAQEHCNDPSTHESGVWFDCYYEDDSYEKRARDNKSKYTPSITKALEACYLDSIPGVY